jgi:hypothetical protein
MIRDEDLKELPLLWSDDFAVLLGQILCPDHHETNHDVLLFEIGLKKSVMNGGRETDDEMEKLNRLTGIYVSCLFTYCRPLLLFPLLLRLIDGRLQS